MKLFSAAVAAMLTFGSFAFAGHLYDNGFEDDYAFDQEKMLLAEDGIYILSSFDDQDGICAYLYNGVLAWAKRFHSKITSWRVAGDYIFVFSKHRTGYKTYLTCLDRDTGYILWERP